MCNEPQRRSGFGARAGAKARPSSPSSTALPIPMSSDAFPGTLQSSCLSLHGNTGPGATGTSASRGRFCGIVGGAAREPSWVPSANCLRRAGLSKLERVAGTVAGSTRSPTTRLMNPTSTRSRPPMWRLTCGSNGGISSRYAEQLGRYAEQWPKSLLRIQTKLVAIRSSQPLIHTPHWSLCAHLSRYLPSGACWLGTWIVLRSCFEEDTL